jgi:hypothetical protein
VSETKILAIPTHVRASIDKDGRKRPGHIATRHRAVPVAGETAAGGTFSPLDGFIAKHGGAEHLRKTLEDMTADQRAKLLDAMAHVEGTDPAAVMKKLGIHEPEASEDQAAIDQALEDLRARMAAAKDAAVITSDEYDLITGICEKDGLEAAIAALAQLREPVIEQQPDSGPTAAAAVALEQSAEGAAGIRAALQAQADSIYQQHVAATNDAVRADFEIEKREIRKWKIPQAMRDDATRLHLEAAGYLQKWQDFRAEHGLDSGLS